MYGFRVWDENGNLVIDGETLLHRLWHTATVGTSNNSIMYPEPLNHEPTVVAHGIGGFPPQWSHIVSGGQYTGLSLTNQRFNQAPQSVFFIFARR